MAAKLPWPDRLAARRCFAAILLAACSCAPPGRGGGDGGGGGNAGADGDGGGNPGGKGGGAGAGGGAGGGPGGGGVPGTCAAAAAGRSSAVGCLFYAVDNDNTNIDNPEGFGFPVGNPGTAPATVKVQSASGPGAWGETITAVVPPGEVAYMQMVSGGKKRDYHIEGSGQEYKAYRIESDVPIVAYVIDADDSSGISQSSGSTLLLPVHALGTRYFAVTPPDRGLDRPPPGVYTGDGPDDAFIDVIGVQDGTKVKVTVAGATKAGGSVPALTAGASFETTLGEGEVLQIESRNNNDLSGSEITSDKPAAVIAGNVCGMFGRTGGGCDHMEEMMYPVTTWGKSFVFLDMRIREYNTPSRSVWGRIVASEDATTVTFDPPRPLSGVPTAPVMLRRGEVYRLAIEEAVAKGSRAHFAINSDKPIAVQSFMGVEEGTAVVIPVDQFLDSYLVSSHPYFNGFLMVTRRAGTPVTFDGMGIPDSAFLPGGAGFEVSYMPMTRCDKDPTRCGHRVAGSKIGVTVTANGGNCNYCYAGGAGARCINATAGCL